MTRSLTDATKSPTHSYEYQVACTNARKALKFHNLITSQHVVVLLLYKFHMQNLKPSVATIKFNSSLFEIDNILIHFLKDLGPVYLYTHEQIENSTRFLAVISTHQDSRVTSRSPELPFRSSFRLVIFSTSLVH